MSIRNLSVFSFIVSLSILGCEGGGSRKSPDTPVENTSTAGESNEGKAQAGEDGKNLEGGPEADAGNVIDPVGTSGSDSMTDKAEITGLWSRCTLAIPITHSFDGLEVTTPFRSTQYRFEFRADGTGEQTSVNYSDENCGSEITSSDIANYVSAYEKACVGTPTNPDLADSCRSTAKQFGNILSEAAVETSLNFQFVAAAVTAGEIGTLDFTYPSVRGTFPPYTSYKIIKDELMIAHAYNNPPAPSMSGATEDRRPADFSKAVTYKRQR